MRSRCTMAIRYFGSSAAVPTTRARSSSTACRSRPAWSCSTRSTGSRRTRRPTSRCAGTARRPSAARAAPRSTASRRSCARRASPTSPAGEPITVEPIKTFPLISDLVTDVSWNYEVNSRIPPFTPPADAPQEAGAGSRRTSSASQEFRKCIECFLCQDVCHVLRNHETKNAVPGPALPGARGRARDAPDGQGDRLALPQDEARHRLLQHHQVLHRGLPGAHQDHRQRHHPAQGARRRRYYDPLQAAWRAIAGTGRRRPAREAGPAAPARRRLARGRETATADGLRLLIHTDGAARGNPGPAGAGAALRDAADGSLVSELAVFLGRRTNNYAE